MGARIRRVRLGWGAKAVVTTETRHHAVRPWASQSLRRLGRQTPCLCPPGAQHPSWGYNHSPGSSPEKGSRVGTGGAQGQSTSPTQEESRAVAGARSPKACQWGCQGPGFARQHPGSSRPSGRGWVAGPRMPHGATGAADPKLKFIFPTVADSWSGCGSREAGKFCRPRAGRRPG